MLTRPAAAILCLLGVPVALGLSGCRGTGHRIGYPRTACRQQQFSPYDGQAPADAREYDPRPSQSAPGRVGPSLAPPAEQSSGRTTTRPRRITPAPVERPMPVPPAPRFGALPASSVPRREAGSRFSPQDPIAEPIESQRKLFPRPTKMPRVLEGMRQRLRHMFRRDATVRAAGPAYRPGDSPDGIGFRGNSPDGESRIQTGDSDGRSRYASTQPVAYRRPLPLSDLNGERIRPQITPAVSGSLVKLGVPETSRQRIDRSGLVLAMTGNPFQRVTPRQAGPSANRSPLMAVPLDDEPLETWPHSPSAAMSRD